VIGELPKQGQKDKITTKGNKMIYSLIMITTQNGIETWSLSKSQHIELPAR
jgi:histidinol phosphatase-like enzyme